MISPMLTDPELLRACELSGSHQVRILADRLRRRVDQLGAIRRVADSPTDDPVQTLADIADMAKPD
jgi:hypothetical protein